MLSVSSWLAKTNTNVMSRASKVVLGISVVLTLSTVTAVHLKQAWDSQVGLSEATAVIDAEQAACRLDSDGQATSKGPVGPSKDQERNIFDLESTPMK